MAWKLTYLGETIDIVDLKDKAYAKKGFMKFIKVEKATDKEDKEFKKELDKTFKKVWNK